LLQTQDQCPWLLPVLFQDLRLLAALESLLVIALVLRVDSAVIPKLMLSHYFKLVNLLLAIHFDSIIAKVVIDFTILEAPNWLATLQASLLLLIRYRFSNLQAIHQA